MTNATHACPNCGEQTAGSYSEGGIKWAICEGCAESSREERRDAQLRYDAEGDYPDDAEDGEDTNVEDSYGR